MTLVERPRTEYPVHYSEREFNRQGVILVLAHMAHTGEPSICLLRHNRNDRKGIREGDLGLPSETIEPSDASGGDDNAALSAVYRLFSEELGMNDPRRFGLYTTPHCGVEGFTHTFNLDTGLNGDSSNALGYGLVLWVPNPVPVMRAFQHGQSKGLIDTGELSGISFIPVSEMFDPSTKRTFRTAPHAPTIVRQVMDAGMLRHP